MRNIFDKLERASNLVRLGILAIMLLILVSGLIFLKPAQKNTGSAKTVSYSRRSSSSKASSTKKASSEDNTIQDAEVAVKKLEEERTDESLTQAQAAVDKVKDEDAKAKFQGRIQAVKDAMKTPEESTEPDSDQQQSFSHTPVAPVYRTPAISIEPRIQPQESSTPAPSSSPEVTPSPSSEIPSPSSDTSGASSNTVVPSQTSSEK